MNWFLHDKQSGTTKVQIAEADEAGRFGDRLEDFDEVALEAENRYLSAAESRLAKRKPLVAKVRSPVLVIDASVAHAAGNVSMNPTSQSCRQFLQAQNRVASLDDQVRGHIQAHRDKRPEVRAICWFNPSDLAEEAVNWLKSGAQSDSFRKLGYASAEPEG